MNRGATHYWVQLYSALPTALSAPDRTKNLSATLHGVELNIFVFTSPLGAASERFTATPILRFTKRSHLGYLTCAEFAACAGGGIGVRLAKGEA